MTALAEHWTRIPSYKIVMQVPAVVAASSQQRSRPAASSGPGQSQQQSRPAASSGTGQQGAAVTASSQQQSRPATGSGPGQQPAASSGPGQQPAVVPASSQQRSRPAASSGPGKQPSAVVGSSQQRSRPAARSGPGLQQDQKDLISTMSKVVVALLKNSDLPEEVKKRLYSRMPATPPLYELPKTQKEVVHLYLTQSVHPSRDCPDNWRHF
ncbi:spidroin-2-like [Schistocerca serialis cubense]|uniref:spidroin-2-like n=1 Tax=Schistocerca serialis cubense TaxID=2023355 RepID=UPI00214F236A|nr:spidroin-2-like [Schistocerca serialis cubense]